LSEITDRLAAPERPVEPVSANIAVLAEAQRDRPSRTADAAAKPAEDRGRPDRTADQQRPADLDLTYWQQVEHLEALSADHLEKWPEPEKQLAADRARPGDPPGSWRGEGDRYLSPEENAESDRLIALLREPEEITTKTLVQIQQENLYGGRLEGLDHRFKRTERLKEKIADKIGVKADTGPAEAVGAIADAIRYTFSFRKDDYVSGYRDVEKRLEDAGFQTTYRKNHWLGDPQYKGINTRWTAPGGARFELQVHTHESFHAKDQLTHPSYRRLRTPGVSRAERRALIAFERTVSAAVSAPSGVGETHDRAERT
jgi:hypothetical protein